MSSRLLTLYFTAGLAREIRRARREYARSRGRAQETIAPAAR